MADIKHTWTRGIKNDAGNSVISETTIYTAVAEVNIREAVTAGTNDDIACNVDVSTLESFFIKSDKDVTLKTYVGATLKQTIAMTANVALAWNTDLGTNPLTDDFNKINVDNAGLTTANIVAGFL